LSEGGHRNLGISGVQHKSGPVHTPMVVILVFSSVMCRKESLQYTVALEICLYFVVLFYEFRIRSRHKMKPPQLSNNKVVPGKSQDTQGNSRNDAGGELGEDSDDEAFAKIDIDKELLKLKEMLPVLTREDFITVYKLEGDGTNPHKIKKDEVKEDSVSDLFGRRCGK
jgi:hypothetical protein